jgi:hypothetical protein
MNRRTFLLSSACAAVASLIPFRPRKLVLYGDGIHDDTEALRGWFQGNYENVVWPDGSPVGRTLLHGTYLLSGTAIAFSDPFGPKAVNQSFCYNQLNFIPEGEFEGSL